MRPSSRGFGGLRALRTVRLWTGLWTGHRQETTAHDEQVEHCRPWRAAPASARACVPLLRQPRVHYRCRRSRAADGDARRASHPGAHSLALVRPRGRLALAPPLHVPPDDAADIGGVPALCGGAVDGGAAQLWDLRADPRAAASDRAAAGAVRLL